jgi:S1-C subfamily serine protease
MESAMKTISKNSKHRALPAMAFGLLLGATTLASAAFADTAGTALPRRSAIDDLFDAHGQGNAPDRYLSRRPTFRASMSASEVYEAAKSAIARIVVTAPVEARGTGTGFLVDGRGDIVTDCHVVKGATGRATIVVIFADDQVPRSGKVLGCDEPGDIAVLQVDGDMSRRQPLQFARPGTFKTGEDIVAIGYAKAMAGEPSIKRGLISAMHRSAGSHSDLVQTDTPINGGDSGGPLLNMRGEVVAVIEGGFEGTMTAKNLKEIIDGGDTSLQVIAGINFGRSATTAQAFAQKIIATGKVERPDLGIDVEVAGTQGSLWVLPQPGVVVKSVKPGSPAARAGIRANEIIYKLGNGKIWPTPSIRDFQDALALIEPGQPIKIGRYWLSQNGVDAISSGQPAATSDVTYEEAIVSAIGSAPHSAER